MASAKQTVDLVINGIAELATPIGSEPRRNPELGQLELIEHAAIAVDAGKIVGVGTQVALARDFEARTSVDANGALAIPGFVDAHTHPVFHGTREHEFEMRVAGKSYVEIAEAGGGILSSVRGVRESTADTLLDDLLLRLDRFVQLGTTTVEAKTGYGLSLEDELKSLEVIARANRMHPVELVPTFLGAHAFPPEFADQHSRYVDLLIEEMLPRVAETGLAKYADIFTESHVFGLSDSRRIMQRAHDLGLGLRMHVDQLTPLGGAQLAAELNAASADHLECVTQEGIDALARSGVIPVLCPLVPLFIGQEAEAPGRAMIEGGLAPALATDFNPGSCYTQSMPEVLTWSALRLGFSAAEALTAATLNAACSLGLGAELGSLEVGKRADVVLTDLPNHRHLTYEFGRNPVQAVFKDGRLLYSAPQASVRS